MGKRHAAKDPGQYFPDGTPIWIPACDRVPVWADTTTDGSQVTCKWCLRWMRWEREGGDDGEG